MVVFDFTKQLIVQEHESYSELSVEYNNFNNIKRALHAFQVTIQASTFLREECTLQVKDVALIGSYSAHLKYMVDKMSVFFDFDIASATNSKERDYERKPVNNN